MNNVTMWGWWYGMFLGLPLILAGLLVKDWIARPVQQRIAVKHIDPNNKEV